MYDYTTCLDKPSDEAYLLVILELYDETQVLVCKIVGKGEMSIVIGPAWASRCAEVGLLNPGSIHLICAQEIYVPFKIISI